MANYFLATVSILVLASTNSALAQPRNIFQDAPPAAPPIQREQTPPRPYAAAWDSLDPEHKFAAVIESFWRFAHSSTQSDFSSKTKFPEACRISFVETQPIPSDVQRTWDGEIKGDYQTAKSLELDLRTLDPELIENIRPGEIYALYFEVTSPDVKPIGFLMSSHPDEWIKPPPPPMIKDIKGIWGDKNKRLEQLAVARAKWSQETYSEFGKLYPPYFSLTGYDSDAATNSQKGLERLASRAGRLYIKLSTPNIVQSIDARAPDGTNVSNARFVDAVKSVLSKCH